MKNVRVNKPQHPLHFAAGDVDAGSIAASGIGAIIPGMINIEMAREHNFVLRAGGAIALFVLIYLINPPSFL